MITFTEEQLQAIHSEAQYLRLLACAGSGKTTVLTYRLAQLITLKKISAQNIAAITFTNLAADELTFRLGKLIQDKKILSNIFIGTIHSFCLNLLREYSELISRDIRVLSENQRFILLNQKWRDWNFEEINTSSSKSDFITKFATSLDIQRMEQITYKELEQVNPRISIACKLYEDFLNENNFIDYTSMLVKVKILLENDVSFRNQVREKYKYLFVDEYQDVDPIQEKVIQIISEGQSLFVVGDDDQAIYQFRGTDVSGFLNFSDLYKNAELLSLTENRRCRENVLSVAKEIISENTNRINKKMKAKNAGGKVTFSEFNTIEEEAEFICSEIIRLKNCGDVNFNDVAILLRSVASYGESYIRALNVAGIPYISKGGHAMFEQREIIKIVNCLEFIAKEEERTENINLLLPILGDFPTFPNIDGAGYEIFDLTVFIKLGLSENAFDLFSKILDIRSRYFQGKFESLLEIVYLVINALHLLVPDLDESAYYNTALLTQIVNEFDEIEQTKKLHRLCAFISMFASKRTDEATPLEERFEAVNVLTIHQAKGLEYKVVFCPMLVERRFPNTANSKRWLIPDNLFNSSRYVNKIEDERRLFYVATTRAKSYLYLLCAHDIGLRNLVSPSEFYINSKLSNLSSDQSTNDQVSSNKNNDVALNSSYSSLEYYITCPYRYKLHIKYKFQTPVNPFFEFGRVIHLVAGLMHQYFLNGEDISEESIEKLYFNNFKMRYRVPKYVLETRKRAGLKALKNYWSNYKNYFVGCMGIETPFAYYTNDTLLKGRIDLLVKNSKGIEIVDFKTGRPHEALRRDFQMEVYSMAAINQLGLDIRKATLLFLEHDTAESFDVSPEFLKKGENELKNLLDRIKSEKFNATPGTFCTRCEYRKICGYSMN